MNYSFISYKPRASDDWRSLVIGNNCEFLKFFFALFLVLWTRGGAWTGNYVCALCQDFRISPNIICVFMSNSTSGFPLHTHSCSARPPSRSCRANINKSETLPAKCLGWHTHEHRTYSNTLSTGTDTGNSIDIGIGTITIKPFGHWNDKRHYEHYIRVSQSRSKRLFVAQAKRMKIMYIILSHLWTSWRR